MGTIEDNLIGMRNGKFGVEPELLRPTDLSPADEAHREAQGRPP
ncbi:hypothetical protein [Streptomyces sp. 150FB]|nr:hypothetical protein [Streptomyces sp. 150FB]